LQFFASRHSGHLNAHQAPYKLPFTVES